MIASPALSELIIVERQDEGNQIFGWRAKLGSDKIKAKIAESVYF